MFSLGRSLLQGGNVLDAFHGTDRIVSSAGRLFHLGIHIPTWVLLGLSHTCTHLKQRSQAGGCFTLLQVLNFLEGCTTYTDSNNVTYPNRCGQGLPVYYRSRTQCGVKTFCLWFLSISVSNRGERSSLPISMNVYIPECWHINDSL